MNDAKLIAGLKAGEYGSYELLFRLHYVRFVNFAASVIGDKEAAKDLVQEAFMKVWLNRAKLDVSMSIGSYLYVLVKRSALNFLRDRKFAERLTRELEQSISHSSDGDRTVDADDALRRVANGVEHLPDQRKTVFLMSRKDGLSNQEIADELNLSVKTVERHISLALSDLRKILS